MTDERQEQRIGQFVIGINEQHKRLSRLKAKATGLASRLKEIASRLEARAKDNTEPPATRSNPSDCPSADDVIETYSGRAKAREQIRALRDRLKSLDITLE